MMTLLTDPAARQAQFDAFEQALSQIGFGGELPSHKAAEKILAVVAARAA
jgi:hypothetical protein